MFKGNKSSREEGRRRVGEGIEKVVGLWVKGGKRNSLIIEEKIDI